MFAKVGGIPMPFRAQARATDGKEVICLISVGATDHRFVLAADAAIEVGKQLVQAAMEAKGAAHGRI